MTRSRRDGNADDSPTRKSGANDWMVYFPCIVIGAAHACVVLGAAHTVSADRVLHNHRGDPLLHGFVENVASAPSLARWDSIWYYGFAAKGYIGEGGEAPLTGGFAPLYGVLMRWVGDAAGCDYFTAGAWISLVAYFAALLLFAAHVRDREGDAVPGWAAVATLLAFPLAFILVSVYSEAVFLALTLAAFVLARRGKYALAAAAAFAAGLTRIHGVALVPALAVVGWAQWRARRVERHPLASHGRADAGEKEHARSSGGHARWGALGAMLPAVGAAGAYLALGGYFWARTGDPLGYFEAKRQGGQQSFSSQWATLATALEHLDLSIARPGLGTILTALELPCFYLIVAAVALLCARRRWPEATFVAGAGAITLCSDRLAGLPRYTLVMFPIFVLLARLRSRPVLWGAYLAVGIVMQACLVINFVRFGLPAP